MRRLLSWLVVAAACMARPALAQGGMEAVPAYLKDLNASWRRVSIRLIPSSSGQSLMAQSLSLLSGGDQPKVYYTQGKTVEWAGRTFLVASRPPEKPINPAAMQAVDRPDQIMDVLAPAPKPDDPMETALIPLDAIAGIEGVQPFHLEQAVKDRSVIAGPVATMAAMLFPVFSQAREKAQEASSVSNLRQIALAAVMYSQDWDEVLPPMKDMATAKKALMPYCKNEAIFVDPRTNQPYRVNPAASKKSLGRIVAPAEFVLFYEAEPGRDGNRAAAFVDGHVKRLTVPEWEMAKRKSSIP